MRRCLRRSCAAIERCAGPCSSPLHADARAVAYVMDTGAFPFFPAEVYHQFHDGFNLDENYPASYNRLARELVATGGVVDSGCPNGLLGVGIGGL